MKGHSAHIGEHVTVHYPHHPLFGKRVRRQGVYHREGGAVAHVETAPGNVIVIPTWMLDPIAYAGMEIGKPRASLEALIMAFDSVTTRGMSPRQSEAALMALAMLLMEAACVAEKEAPHERV